MAVAFSSGAYARQLAQLLPRGPAWRAESGSVLAGLLLAIADELARVDERARALGTEGDPRTAVETLPEWEAALGLPDDCIEQIPQTTGERQVAVAHRLASRGGQSRPFFIALAETLGYPGATIEEYQFAQLRVGFRAGDRCTGDAWAHAWRINLPGPGPGHTQIDVECVVRRAAPAHTIVVFSYT